jgi:hypothetical protein
MVRRWQGKVERIWSSTVQNAVVNVPKTKTPRQNTTVAKKAHTDKNLVLVNTHSQKVVYLSDTQAGKKHDKKQADEATLAYPVCATLGKDTGFQGYQPPAVMAWQPTKKSRGHPLSVEDQHLNALLSSARIVVEHTLSGVKRCHLVKDVFRNTKVGFTDTVIEVACALHNLRVHFRHPVPTLNILDF